MFEIIREIVVKWDPIGLMNIAPPDEYDSECRIIYDGLKRKNVPLGKTIYEVFKDRFGETFQADLSKCQQIATEIENRINKD